MGNAHKMGGMADAVELDVDARGRVSLGKLRQENTRYRATALDDGEIVLTPVVSVSAREMAMLRNPAVSRRLRTAIHQAEAGKVTRYEPGHFTKLVEETGENED
jgi:hypothetical protein